VPAKECVTVDDYRQRYASYRLDPNLAALHARHPMIWVWDDHETCDGAWRDGADPKNHGDDESDGKWSDRKAAALQAALEWMPVRTVDPTNPERIYRRFAFGDLVDLFMLDTRRIGRDEPIIDAGVVPETEFFRQEGRFVDPSRQLLGAAQEAWLFDGLRSSTARWRFLGNQVVLSQIKVVGVPDATCQAVYANPDQWDGYAPARDRLFDVLEGLSDVVVLTGDVHASMAYEVSRDPSDPTIYDPVTSRGSMAVELVAPSVSSAGDPKPVTELPSDGDDVVDLLASRNGDGLRAANPHMKYVRTQLNGHLLVDVTREAVTAEFWLVPQVSTPTTEQSLDKTYVVR
jgi:alkaline phosphatase D